MGSRTVGADLIAAIHWANVAFALVLALPAVVAGWFAYMTYENVQTPSGDPIGSVSERTHDLAATNSAQLQVHGKELGVGKIDHLSKNVGDCFEQMFSVLEELKAEQERLRQQKAQK